MSNGSDLILIGGGVIGLCCAWRLALSGMRVVLLEKNRCGSGSSEASLGALWPSPATKRNPLQILHRNCLWNFHKFVHEIANVTGMDIGFDRRGRFEAILNEKRLQQTLDEVEAAQAEWPSWLGQPVMRILSQEEAQRVEPNCIVTEFGAVQCRATAQVIPERMVYALKSACELAGATIVENEPVQSLMIDNGRIRGVEGSATDYLADTVLVTAGAWTPLLDVILKKSAPIQPLKGQAMLLHLERPLFSHIVKRGTIYLVRRDEHHALLGATSEPEAGYDETTTPEAREQLWEEAIAFVPALASATVVRTWAGLRPASAIRKPIMGPVPGMEGLWVAAGHGKIGIGMAPSVGRWMAEWITQGRAEVDLERFKPCF